MTREDKDLAERALTAVKEQACRPLKESWDRMVQTGLIDEQGNLSDKYDAEVDISCSDSSEED